VECDGTAGAALQTTGVRHGRVEAEKLARQVLSKLGENGKVKPEDFRAVLDLWECHASKKRKKTDRMEPTRCIPIHLVWWTQ